MRRPRNSLQNFNWSWGFWQLEEHNASQDETMPMGVDLVPRQRLLDGPCTVKILLGVTFMCLKHTWHRTYQRHERCFGYSFL